LYLLHVRASGLAKPYVVEFKTAAAEALAISVPRSEVTVLKHVPSSFGP
jgi:hypothetical protein